MEYVKLGDLISLVIDYRGKTPLKLKGEWASEGYRALSALNVKTGGLVAEDKIRFVNEDLYHKWMKQEVKRGDILITSEAPFGQVLQWNSDEKIVLSQRLFAIRIKTDVDNRYVYYYMTSQPFQGELKARATGSTVEGLRQPALMKCRLALPGVPLQHRIASILSTYDSLIENNTKRIRLLGKMAENLYKEWFVRFRYPGHENVEMENGLPKGWRVKKYEDELNVKYGKGLPTDKLTKDGFPVFGSNGQIGYYTSYMYDTPQILISCRGASSGVVNISLPKSFITNNSLICEMTNKTESVFEYLKYYFLNTNLVQYQTGSAQPQITINNIVKLKLLIPSTDIQIKFADKVRTLDKEVGNLQHQNSLLACQRDLLLPRLMSGKLEVKEELLE